MLCKKCKREIPDGSLYCNWCGIRQEPARKTRTNGEGTVFMTKTGKWKAEVNIYRDGKRYAASKAGLPSKHAALTYLPALREKALNATVRPADATIKQLYEEVTARWYPRISKDKAGHYRTAWASIKSIHNAKIGGLRYADLQPLIDERAGGYYPKRDIKVLLGRIYDLAIKYEYIDKDYSAMLDLPPVKGNERSALTREEVQALWRDYSAGHPNTKYFLIMCYTGMRTGEILTVQKRNVHLHERYCTGGIKTEAGKARQIIFCDKIMPLVEEAYHENEKLLCELGTDAFYGEWHAMVQRAGLREELTPYCCRHTAPTMLAEEGVQPAIIQQIMGHTSYSMTAEHYTHISIDAKLDALNKLG